MKNGHCPYCGSENILDFNRSPNLDRNCLMFHCQNCQMMFTDLERRFELDETPLDYKPSFDAGDEIATLEAVWNIMTDRGTFWKIQIVDPIYKWPFAFELLFQHAYPLQYPLEFMIYRIYWQLNEAMTRYSILTMHPTGYYDHCVTCTELFDVLINNLSHLEYYLSALDEERRLQAMQRLSEVLYELRNIPIFIGKIEAVRRTEFAAAIVKQRCQALINLAEQAENLGDASNPNGLVYLKMAAQLWNSCQATTTVYCETLYYRDNDFCTYRQVPDDLAVLISKKVAELCSAIRQKDPHFDIKKPIKKTKMRVNLYIWAGTLGICVGIPALVEMCFILSDIFDISVNNGVFIFAMCGGCAIIFLALLVVPIMSVCASFKNSKMQKRAEAKRLQIYERLYCSF